MNPRSGRGTATRVAGSVVSALRAAVPALVATVTADAAATSRVAAQAAQRGDDVLVVFGGDGTVHLAAQAVAGTATALAVVPGGSGNDLAAALGIPIEPVAAAEHVAEALRSGWRRRIDVGRVSGGACFATVLCTGFDALVNARANAMRWPAGPRRYDLAVLAELAALTPSPVRLQVDNRPVALETSLVAGGNAPCHGGGV